MMDRMTAILASALRKSYGSVTAVDGVDLTVRTGEFFGILGPNGAGKTTLLEMVEGLRKPDSGRVELLGADPLDRSPALLGRIGVQFQASAFFDRLTAREQLRTFAALYGLGAEPAATWLERVGLTEQAGSRTEDLSGGQRQRLAIACALVHEPELVFLDEPTAALDPQARRNLWDLLRSLQAEGRTVVLTTHHLDEAETLCDRVAIMDHGRVLVEDTPAALVRGLDAPTRVTVAPGRLDPDQQAALPALEGREERPDGLVLTTRSPSPLLVAAGRARRPGGAPGARRHPGGRVPGPDRTGVPRMRPGGTAGIGMTAFRGVAVALLKGFVRDRTSLFFALAFPLLFLVLFGGIFNYTSTPRLDLVAVGAVPVVDDLPEGARAAFDQSFAVRRTTDRAAALQDVRSGDADVAVEMDGDTLVAHYTQTDQVRAAMVRGTLASYVDAANQGLSRQPATYSFRAQPVEDASLKTIQFVTPGLLGWAVATSAAFGAAATLQGWRQTMLLRRIQLSPAPAAAVVSARIVVTVAIALTQMAMFLGLGTAAFGLQLSGTWWLAVPLLVLGTLCFMTLGLLAGALARTAEAAVNLANVVVLPMAFLSGSFFPLDGAPAWLRTISLALPLRHLNDAMLDVMVRGQGVTGVLADAAYLVVFGLVVGTLAVVLFRRRQA